MVFSAFGNSESGLFVALIVTISGMGEDAILKPTARVKAEAFREPLRKYETILTAQVLLRTFEHTSTLSKYMQTKGMDILTVQRLVMGTQKSLRKCTKDFRRQQTRLYCGQMRSCRATLTVRLKSREACQKKG